MDYMNPSKISKKVYVDEAIRPVLTTYYKQLTEIAEYFFIYRQMCGCKI